MTRRTQAQSAARCQERVLGLDVSSVCVGWAVFEHGMPQDHGKYKQVGAGHGEKLARFEQWLLVQLRKYQPTHLVIEAPYAGRRRFAFGVLMMYFGAVLNVYYVWSRDELPAHARVPAHMVKRTLGAKKGRSYEQRKKDMVLMINQLYSTKFRYKANDPKKTTSDDDVADAYALVRAWLLRGGSEAGSDE